MVSSPDQLTNISNPRYSFTEIKTDELIDSAFRLIGLDLAQISENKSYEAIKSLNEILIEWISQGILQFNEKRFLIPLVNNKSAYNLPAQVYDIFTIVQGFFNRLIGTPFGYNIVSGTITDAFDYNYNTFVNLSSTSILGTELALENGSYPLCWGLGLSVSSAKPVSFKLYGTNVIDADYTKLKYANVLYDSVRPVEFNSTDGLQGIQDIEGMKWFCINAPTPYKYLYIMFNGNVSIAQLSLLKYQRSQNIGISGRETLMKITYQNQVNNITGCAIEKNNKHVTVRLRGVATQVPATYNDPVQLQYPNFLYLQGVELPFSVNYLQTTIDIHYRFAGALRAYLAFELAKQYAPDKVQFLGSEANRKFMLALNDNKDLQSIQINLPNSRTWG